MYSTSSVWLIGCKYPFPCLTRLVVVCVLSNVFSESMFRFSLNGSTVKRYSKGDFNLQLNLHIHIFKMILKYLKILEMPVFYCYEIAIQLIHCNQLCNNFNPLLC